MSGSYNDAITRLEGILCELECEFLYLISDMSTEADDPEYLTELQLDRLEIARHCLSVAAKALRAEPDAIRLS